MIKTWDKTTEGRKELREYMINESHLDKQVQKGILKQQCSVLMDECPEKASKGHLSSLSGKPLIVQDTTPWSLVTPPGLAGCCHPILPKLSPYALLQGFPQCNYLCISLPTCMGRPGCCLIFCNISVRYLSTYWAPRKYFKNELTHLWLFLDA